MQPEKMTSQTGVTREYLESIERTFAIVTFFMFLASVTCGCGLAYAINAKCCKGGSSSKGEMNVGGVRREANTLEMQVVGTESPGASPASRGSRPRGL